MYLQSFAPENHHLAQGIQNYMTSLRAVGLVTEKDGLWQMIANTNPRMPDHIRARLLEPEPKTVRFKDLEGPAPSPRHENPTTMMPEKPTVKRKGRGKSRGRGRKGVKRSTSNASKQGAAKRARK